MNDHRNISQIKPNTNKNTKYVFSIKYQIWTTMTNFNHTIVDDVVTD